MGGLFSSKTSTSSAPQTVTQDPWSGAQAGLHTLFDAATNQFNSGAPKYYPGQLVAGQSGATQSGLNLGQQAAGNGTTNFYGGGTLDAAQLQNWKTNDGAYMNGDPSMSGASMFGSGNNVGNTAGDSQLNAIGNGAMLYGNPYVDAMFNHAAGQVGQQYSQNVMPGIASMFEGAGRMGSDQMANGLGQAQQQYGNTLNGLASSIYGGNYANERNLQQQSLNQLNSTGLAERGQQLSGLGMLSNQFQNERNRQMTASGMAPGLASGDYNDVNQLLKMGGMQDLYSQSQINADKARYDYGQTAPWSNLSNLASIMNTSSPYGTKNTSGGNTTTSEGPSPFGAILGLASMASGLGSVFAPSVLL